MTQITRRRFLAVTGASLAGSSLALMGFSPSAALAEVRSRINELQEKVEADQSEHDTLARDMQTVERRIAKAGATMRDLKRKLGEQQRKMRETQADQNWPPTMPCRSRAISVL